MEQGTFERLRKELFREVLELNNSDCDFINNKNLQNLKPNFDKRFFELIELCNLSLMGSEDNFFALFFVQIKRKISFKITTAIATKISGTCFVIYFNPALFLECNLNQMQALIKHEIYHIMSKHYSRAKALKNKYSELAISLAMDISINQYIMYLPAWSEDLEKVKNTYNIDLKEEQTMEEYAVLIQEGIDKLTKEGKSIDKKAKTNHEIWNDMDENSYAEQMDELVRKVAGNASRGKMPESIDLLIKSLDKYSKISWKDYLKRTIGILPVGHKKTVTRKDRRQPERLDLRGKLSNRISQILVAIDISGSISDKEIENIMLEIFSIVKNYPYEITIIECDSEIRRVYKVKSMKDVKQKIDTKGGTLFNPVFKYIYENRMKEHVLIYFTDGLGEKVLSTRPYNFRTIWVLTGNESELSLKDPMGVVIKINSNSAKKEEINVVEFIKNEMQDTPREWAR